MKLANREIVEPQARIDVHIHRPTPPGRAGPEAWKDLVDPGELTESGVRSGMTLMIRVRSATLGIRVSDGFDRHCSVMRLTTFGLVFGAQRREHDGVMVNRSFTTRVDPSSQIDRRLHLTS
jgi:hypothetical protein